MKYQDLSTTLRFRAVLCNACQCSVCSGRPSNESDKRGYGSKSSRMNHQALSTTLRYRALLCPWSSTYTNSMSAPRQCTPHLCSSPRCACTGMILHRLATLHCCAMSKQVIMAIWKFLNRLLIRCHRPSSDYDTLSDIPRDTVKMLQSPTPGLGGCCFWGTGSPIPTWKCLWEAFKRASQLGKGDWRRRPFARSLGT